MPASKMVNAALGLGGAALLAHAAVAVNDAVIQTPQLAARADFYVTSRTASAAAQPISVNAGQATLSVPARSISTVVFTL